MIHDTNYEQFPSLFLSRSFPTKSVGAIPKWLSSKLLETSVDLSSTILKGLEKQLSMVTLSKTENPPSFRCQCSIGGRCPHARVRPALSAVFGVAPGRDTPHLSTGKGGF